MKYSILIFFIFSLSIGICTGEIIKEKTSEEYKKDMGGISNDVSGKGGSSSPRVVIPSETPSMNVSWKIISPKREDGYYLDDVIVVQVTVTSLNKDGLEDVEIWEIPGSGIEVLNCSYPITTSAVGQILDYEKSDKSFIRNADMNISSVVSKFKSENRSKEIQHIFKMLPTNTQNNITNVDQNKASALGVLKSELLGEFNRIIDNKSITDLNASFFEISPTVLNDDLDYWIKLDDKIDYFRYIEQEDYRLIKRRLLEFAFKNDTAKNFDGIRKLSFIKKHENKLNELEPISYYVPNLHNRESIILKYYLRPTKIGQTDLRSIVRSKDHLSERINRIKIIRPNPIFSYSISCETTNIKNDTDAYFTYIIKYLGGDKDDTKTYTIYVSSPGNLKIKSIQTPDGKKNNSEESLDNKSIEFEFTKGIPIELLAIVSYNKTGLNNLPIKISVGGCPSDFEENISVFEWWDMPFRVHTEALTWGILALTLLCTLFGSIKVQRQLVSLQRKQNEIMERDSEKREEESRAIRILIIRFTKLLDKKMK